MQNRVTDLVGEGVIALRFVLAVQGPGIELLAEIGTTFHLQGR
ncbi:hypothetical protein [Kitasatospora sp. NPDC047058]